MPAGLLPIIYLAFIGLGLPDSAIGSAWPTMAPDLGAGVSWAGIVTMIISAGTILSSLQSVRVVERFGTGRVTAVSVGLTAAALAGFSVATEFWQLCLLAIPYGLGAGAVDAALNTYVAVHYESQHMSWLHCMWGVGASGGPLIMAQCLGVGSWSLGFLVLGGLQLAIVIVLTLSLPLWRDKALPRMADDADDAGSGDAEGAPISRRALLRRDGVLAVLICFFCYCALESTCGVWAASYCTFARGIDAQTAASWASLFYIGITVGRGVSGFISLKVSDHNMIRLGQALIALGLVLILLPAGNNVLFAGLITVGLGCAPVYPCIIHETPANFGRELSLSMTGLQMACAYVGSCLMPPLFGLLGQHISMALYPWYMAVLLVLMFVMAESLHRKTADRRRDLIL